MLSPPLIRRVCISFLWSENYKKMHSDLTAWLRALCHVIVEFYIFSTTWIFSRENLFQECLSSIFNILVRTLTTWKLTATRQNWNIWHYLKTSVTSCCLVVDYTEQLTFGPEVSESCRYWKECQSLTYRRRRFLTSTESLQFTSEFILVASLVYSDKVIFLI